MRATFAVVLVAGVATAVGLSMMMRHGGEAESPPDRLLDPAPGPSPQPAPPEPGREARDRGEAVTALAARIEGLLAKSDLTGAARVVLAAESKEFSGESARERSFRVADSLVASAERSSDAAATSSRLDARRIYALLYRCDAATPDEMTRAYDACARLNQSLLYGNGAPDELVLRHKVAQGESVWALSRGTWKQRGASVPAGFVLYVNGIADARRVRVGQTLRVPLEPLRVLVKKSRFDLSVLLGGVPIERFAVAIGADSSTPAGTFKVKDRVKQPDWYLHGRRIPYGDPQNIIGTRWIGLSGAAAAEGIGIHGTSDDSSIGKAVSMGCVRLHNADVEKLFEWLDTGVDVEIRD